MGYKCKLERNENCQVLRVCTESKIDRLSSLPTEVAHHILSLLSFKDLTRVGSLSRRCRGLYLSIPIVKFDTVPTPICSRRRGELSNSFDRFLTCRGDNRIQCFRLRWVFFNGKTPKELEDFRVITWIHNAIRCKVEELDLDLDAMITYPLLSCLLLCPTLRSLSLNLRGGTLQVPFLSSSYNLRHLLLRNVTFVDERFCSWISSSCRHIKELQLIFIKGMEKMTIDISSLESFKLVSGNDGDLLHLNISGGEKLEEVHIAWLTVSSSASSTTLNISAPNLRKLKLEGDLMNKTRFGKFRSLEMAEILMFHEVNELHNTYEVLRSICKAKTVILNHLTIEALSKEVYEAEPLDDICNLELRLRSLDDDITPAVASILRRVSNLKTLAIKCSIFAGDALCESSAFDMRYWKLQNLVCLNQLKEVNIEPSYEPNEMELASYILEHARNLKKMVISYIGDQLADVVVGMVSKSKMTSTAKVVIRENYRL